MITVTETDKNLHFTLTATGVG